MDVCLLRAKLPSTAFFIKQKWWLSSGASAFIPSCLTVTSYCSMGDEGMWCIRYILLAAVPRVAIDLMEATVSGEWMVETWHAAMETALFCTSVNHSITPGNGGDYIRKRGAARGERLHNFGRTEKRNVLNLLLYLSSRVRRRLLW